MGGEYILIVTDTAPHFKALEGKLKLNGYKVDWALDEYFALEKMETEKKKYDLIICDTTFTKTLGNSLYQQLRDLGIKTKFLVITNREESWADNYDDVKFIKTELSFNRLHRSYNEIRMIIRESILDEHY